MRREHAQRVLEALGEQTGGQAYFPKSLKEVDAIAQRWRRISGRSTRSRITRRNRRVAGWVSADPCGGEREGISRAVGADADWVLPEGGAQSAPAGQPNKSGASAVVF